MSDNNYLEKTFFPRSRKELRVETVQLLNSRADEKRIKLALSMLLSDQKLVGMPEWLAIEYEQICKEGSLTESSKFIHELNEMTMYVHTTEDVDHAALVLFSVKFADFKLGRDGDDLALSFIAYVPDNRKAWGWLYDYGKKSIFVRFDTTQPELPTEKKADPQMKLVPATAVAQ